MRNCSITVAPNGGRRTKKDHPAIPLTPAELAATARECLEVGANMIHFHVRKADGGHLLDVDAYRAAILAIRAEVGDRMILQITSEAMGIYSPAEQMAVVRAVRPQAVSLALRELLPNCSYETAFAEFLAWIRREEILPQIILYDPLEAKQLDRLRCRGLLSCDDIPVLYVLGRYMPEQTSLPKDLLPFHAPGMPRFPHWTACAFGRHEAACVTASGLLGGHVRVGFENNLFLPNGTLASRNADLVQVVAETLSRLGFFKHDSPGGD